MEGARRHVEVSRIIIHINHLLLSLLGALQQQCRREDPHLTSRRRSVELFLQRLRGDAVHASQPWTLSTMAEECAMGTTAFAQYCRQITNQSPSDHLSRCRLQHAARRLRAEPDAPITTIALDCGFGSSQYFATCFQHQFGRTPRNYRVRD